MNEIKLVSKAWYGDTPLLIHFPEAWQVDVIGDTEIPELTSDELEKEINLIFESPALPVITKRDARIAVIIDDLTRPTPVKEILSILMTALSMAGFPDDSIAIVIATGSHQQMSANDIIIKLGQELSTRYQVIPHNCRSDLIDLGRTARGTPLMINRYVYESDIKIGIGCIYPHPAAGFSGGAKIICPGIAGAETIQFMHNHLKGANQRGGSMETEFHREIEDISNIVGLDFLINVVINKKRKICGIFCGDKHLAHMRGIEFVKKHYTILPIQDADIVIADMYPFDTDLQFAQDRGFWPVISADKASSKVILAACPKGIGSHGLYPITRSLVQRYIERIKDISWHDLEAPLEKLRKFQRLYYQKSLDYLVYSPGVIEDELKQIFPNATLYRSWEPLLNDLRGKHPPQSTKVAIYRCAPLLIPSTKG
jgi:nickel-dependent lactate racemase